MAPVIAGFLVTQFYTMKLPGEAPFWATSVISAAALSSRPTWITIADRPLPRGLPLVACQHVEAIYDSRIQVSVNYMLYRSCPGV